MSEWKETEIGRIPFDWDIKKLSEITDKKVTYGIVQPGFHDEEGVSILRVNNIKAGIIDDTEAMKVSKEVVSKYTRTQLNGDEILITLVGNLGEVAIVPKKYAGWNIARAVGKIELKDKSDNYWVFTWLTSKYIKHFIKTHANTTVQHTLNLSDVENLPIVLPPKREREDLSKFISTLNEKISLLRQQNQDLEELAQTIFKRWFVEFEFPNENGEPYKSSGGKMVESELGEIPEGWKVGRFDDIIEFSNGYAFSSKELLDEPTPTTLDVFKMGHIMKGGGFNPSKSKSYIEKVNCKGLEKYILKKGDLLMCMTDMKDNSSLLGHTALMPVDDGFIVNQRVGLIRAKNDLEIYYPYLYILTNSKVFISEIRSRANSGVQVNLSTNGIKETETIIATKEVNKAFNAISNRLFEKVLTNQQEIQTLTQLRNTLLPKLMSGELRVKM